MTREISPRGKRVVQGKRRRADSNRCFRPQARNQEDQSDDAGEHSLLDRLALLPRGHALQLGMAQVAVLNPYVDDPDFTLYVGDVRDVLRGLPDESVHCVVTSPPYWGLRDYGTDGQLGLEPTPDEYVANMVAVFREVRRVLRPTGTLWLNLGDGYSHGGHGSRDPEKWPKQSRNDHRVEHAKAAGGTKPKDLIGAPWKVAFALQADGWYLRSDIIWSKPNPMPESVTDRPTKAHEYVFLLTRSARYFYDADAIREPATYFGPNGSPSTMVGDANSRRGEMRSRAGKRPLVPSQTHAGVGRQGLDSQTFGEPAELGRNKRSVWEIATMPYPEAHFAVFPQALVEPCILAGTSERGCCPDCGVPWERVTPTGWRPTCDHGKQPVGAVVLDPFMGSGTTAVVARRLGRKSIGIELNASYAELCATRLQQLSLLGDVA